jgi:hypothetical protein
MKKPSTRVIFRDRVTTVFHVTLLLVAQLATPALVRSSESLNLCDLSGTWHLSQNQSSITLESLPETMMSGEPVLPVRSYEEWVIATSDSECAISGWRVRELFKVTEKLEIIQDGLEITINATGSDFVVLTRTIYTDGRQSEQRFGSGEKGLSRARWDGNQFIVETDAGRATKLTERYALSPDATRLYVTLRIDNGPWAHSLLIQRVYERQGSVPSD